MMRRTLAACSAASLAVAGLVVTATPGAAAAQVPLTAVWPEVRLPGDHDSLSVRSGRHTFTCPAAQVPVDSDTGPWGAHAHVADPPAG